MTQPLAMVCYADLLPGSRLVNRLQDLGYRVQTLNDPGTLPSCAEMEKPLIVLVELEPSATCAAITRLRKSSATSHVPVIAFARENDVDLQAAARDAGATLVVNSNGLLAQLKELLDQALDVP